MVEFSPSGDDAEGSNSSGRNGDERSKTRTGTHHATDDLNGRVAVPQSGLRQSAIAERLNISQSKVSRLLEQAGDAGIVRTEVVLSHDEQSALETEFESAYCLRESHAYEIGRAPDESQLIRELGQLLALRLQSIALDADVMGFTSWSRTLQEAARQLRPLRRFSTQYVVEMVGDLGPPTFQHPAAQNTQQLADLTGEEPMFLRVPGVVASLEFKQTMLDHDSYARATLKKLNVGRPVGRYRIG